jgi:hypothetical protein
VVVAHKKKLAYYVECDDCGFKCLSMTEMVQHVISEVC